MNDPYSTLTRKLFAAPEHVAASGGEPDTGSSVYTEAQGVRIRLSAVVAGGLITELRFRASGCPHVIAACEWLCRSIEGKPVEALGEFKPAAIMQALAVPVAKTGRILVLEDTARALGERLSRTQDS